MLLFLVVAVSVFLAPPANSVENLTTADAAVLLVSMLFLVTEKVISWKGGGAAGTMMGTVGSIRRQGPDQSKLEELGYRMPPDTADEADVTDVDGEDVVTCSECGIQNEQTFSYCENCSSRLPE